MKTKKSQVSATVFVYAFVAIVVILGLIFGYRGITASQERGFQTELIRLKADIEADVKTLMPQFASIETYTYRVPAIIDKICFADVSIKDPNAIGNKNMQAYPLIKDSVESELNNLFFISSGEVELMEKIERLKISNDAIFACYDITNNLLELTMSGRGISTLILKEFVSSISIPASGLIAETTLSSVDGVMTLILPPGTKATKDSKAITSVSIELIPLLDIDKASALRTELYEFKPDGTTFSSPIQLDMAFNQDVIGRCPSTFIFYQHDADGNLKAEIRSFKVDCAQSIASFMINGFSTGWVAPEFWWDAWKENSNHIPITGFGTGGGGIGDGECGDETCDDGEDCTSCPADCGCSAGYQCVAGNCEEAEPGCGDGTCDDGEDCSSCPADCGCSAGYECVNATCEVSEPPEEPPPIAPPELELSCELVEGNCDNDSICIFSMFNYTNSHVALCDADYPYKLCCNMLDDSGMQTITSNVVNTPCNPGEGLVGSMFQSYNSHLDSRYSSQGGFPDNVCLISTKSGYLLNCHTFDDSLENGYCDAGACVATMYQENNSHIADCATDPYTVSVCCSSITLEGITSGNCDDGLDNDGDGAADFDDPGCSGCNQCSDCGAGLLAICTGEMCFGCGSSCYYDPAFIGGRCYSCDDIVSCEDYGASEQACLYDNCQHNNCFWDEFDCCTDNDNDQVCAIDDPDDLNPLIPLCSGLTSCYDYVASDACLADECGFSDCNWNESVCCTDADMDGVCADIDIDDNDPNLPCDEPDADGDGFIAIECAGNDCDDNEPNVYPGSTETCGDDVDADCDGLLDNGYFLGDTCGTDTCAGTLVCDSLFATKCDSEGTDCGICCVCDAAGEQGFDDTQNNDCGATACPDSGCGIAGCGAEVWGYYPTNVSNECDALFTCSINNCTAECEEDFDGDNYSATCGDCDDTNVDSYPMDLDEYTSALCDGIDNDCDNQSDELCPCVMGDAQDCGTNNCIGTQVCDITGTWGDCSSLAQDCGACCLCDAGGSETYDQTQSTDCEPTSCDEEEGCGADGCPTNIWGSFEGSGTNVCAAKGTCTQNECIANCEKDADKDLYSAACGDCDDNNRRVKPPDISELEKGMIDGIDNDCDGIVDDSLVGGKEIEVGLAPAVRAKGLMGRYESLKEKMNLLLLLIPFVLLVIFIFVFAYMHHKKHAPPKYPTEPEQPPITGQQPMEPEQPTKPMQPEQPQQPPSQPI